MKKSILILVMGLCGSVVFAQDSVEKVDIIKKKQKKTVLVPPVKADQAKQNQIQPLPIIRKKKMKATKKVKLISTKAIRVETKQKLNVKSEEK